MAKDHLTIAQLAEMTQREFQSIREHMATKEDLQGLASKDDLKDISVDLDFW